MAQSWLSKQFTARKLLFNFLFHGLHIGLFVFGWSVLRNPGAQYGSRCANPAQVEASDG